ncbi:MAG: hypothetical protein ACK53Y_27050, partial [bacterium]
MEYSSSYYYMSSYPFAPPIASSLIVPANNKEKTLRNIPVWEKIRQSLPLLEQLQVALWTYMFVRLGLNKAKSIHAFPLQSLQLLS